MFQSTVAAFRAGDSRKRVEYKMTKHPPSLFHGHLIFPGKKPKTVKQCVSRNIA